MGKIVTIVNQKGGVGKTTTCVSLTAALREKGQRVLLCDFDPQARRSVKKMRRWRIFSVGSGSCAAGGALR